MSVENTIKLNGASAFAFHPTLEWIFVGDRRGTLLAWDVSIEKPSMIGIIQVCSQPITYVAWLTTLRMLVTLSKDGNMKVWKTRVIANPNRPPMPANFFETAAIEAIDIPRILSQQGGEAVYPLPRIKAIEFHPKSNLAALVFANAASGDTSKNKIVSNRERRKQLFAVLQGARGCKKYLGTCLNKESNMKSSYLFFTAFMALASCALAFDPSPLQDFCVAINDTNNGVFVNGKLCKDPKLATANDFFFSVKEENTSNSLGSKVTPVAVNEILGLNTLGISLARIDFAPRGLNPPHTHPRATEILIVLEGTLYVGFVTSNPQNRLITKVLNKGDVFVFPIGLIHFQLNVGYGNAVAIGGLSSQNPGVITIANAVFGSNPKISSDVLTKAFQVDNKIVDNLQKQFWYDNNYRCKF